MDVAMGQIPRSTERISSFHKGFLFFRYGVTVDAESGMTMHSQRWRPLSTTTAWPTARPRCVQCRVCECCAALSTDRPVLCIARPCAVYS